MTDGTTQFLDAWSGTQPRASDVLGATLAVTGPAVIVGFAAKNP